MKIKFHPNPIFTLKQLVLICLSIITFCSCNNNRPEKGIVGETSPDSTNEELLSLDEKLSIMSSIMWIGSHPDDELYSSGTFSIATRRLGVYLYIVSFHKRSSDEA